MRWVMGEYREESGEMSVNFSVLVRVVTLISNWTFLTDTEDNIAFTKNMQITTGINNISVFVKVDAVFYFLSP